MTRVAIPENEDYLLMLARHGTAKHLESLVSAYRSALACAESERAQRQRANRRLEWRIDEDGGVRGYLPVNARSWLSSHQSH